MEFFTAALNPRSLSWLFSIKPRLKNYFLIILFYFYFVSQKKKQNREENKQAWLKIKTLFRYDEISKGCIGEWEGKIKKSWKQQNFLKTFSFISFQWLFRFAHSSWNFSSSVSFLELKCISAGILLYFSARFEVLGKHPDFYLTSKHSRDWPLFAQ